MSLWGLPNLLAVPLAGGLAAFVAMRRPPPPLWPVLFVVQVCAFIYAVGDVTTTFLVQDPQWHWFWIVVQYTGICGFVPAWFVLAVRYAESQGHSVAWVGPGWERVPILVSAFFWLCVLTNPWHGAYITQNIEGPRSSFHGLWYLHFALNSVVLVASATIYVSLIRTTRTPSARHTTLFMATVAVTGLIVNTVFVFTRQPLPFNPTATLVGVSSALLLVGIYRNHFFSLLPVALSEVIRHDTDGIVLIDTSGRVLHANPAARRMFAGESLELNADVFVVLARVCRFPDPAASPPGPEGFAQCLTAEPQPAEGHTLRFGDGEARWVRIEASVVPDRLGRAAAYSLRLRDVTEFRRAGRAAMEQASALQAILASTAEGLLVVDLHGHMTYYNAQFQRMWKLPNAIMQSGDDDAALAFVCSQLRDPEAFLARVRDLYASPHAESYDEIALRDGRVFERTSRPLLNEDEAVGRVWSFRDVTEQRANARAVQRSEEIFRAIFEGALDAIITFDMDGVIRSCNPAAERIFGWRAAEAVGRSLIDLGVPARFRPRLEDGFRRYRTSGASTALGRTVELVGLRQDGKEIPLEIALTPIRIGDEHRLLAFMRDITERTEAREALARSEETLRLIVEGSPGFFFYVHDTEGVFTYVSPSVLDITGRSQEDWMRHYTAYLTDSPANRRVVEETERMLREGAGANAYQVEVRHADGYPILLQVYERPVRDGDRVIGIQGVAQDITERQRAVEALQASEARLAKAQEIAKLGNWEWDITHDVLYWSDEIFRLIDAPRDMAPPNLEAFLDLVHPDDREAVGRAVEAAVRDRAPYAIDHRIVLPSGAERVVHEQGEVMYDEAGEPARMIGTAQDITEQHLAKQALAASEARYRELVDNAPLGVIACDTQGQILAVNQQLADMLGSPSIEATRQINLLAFSPLVDAGISGVIQQCLETGETEVVELGYTSVWGKHINFRLHVAPIRGGAAEIAGVQAIVEDVTERKRTEEALLHAQKLESLGILAGGIAHDFNNLLVSVMGNAGLALMELPEATGARAFLEGIEKAAERASELTQQLLAYAGKGKFLIEAVDLSELVEDMTHLLEVSITKSARIQYELANDMPPVEADAAQIRQIVMNLVINAADAIGQHDGLIRVRTGSGEFTLDDLQIAYGGPKLEPGIYAYLEVVDTGCGMDSETQGRIFDPFFSTKFTGRGLGLAAVLGIVRGHRGAMYVQSAPNSGSVFKVCLPTMRGAHPVKRPAPSPRETPEWRGGGTILVVDDDPRVGKVAQAILEHNGFEVVTAADGVEALERLDECNGRIVAVLLDLTMPRMSGEETYAELHRRHPSLPVILSSGFSEQEAMGRFGGAGLAGFIQKPYKAGALVAKVREALGI